MKEKVFAVLCGVYSALLVFSTARASGNEILVGVAASAAGPVKEAGAAFAASAPGARLNFNSAASGVILKQMDTGAGVDLVVFADRATLDQAIGKNLVVPSTVFLVAENSVVLAFSSVFAGKVEEVKDIPTAGFARIASGNPVYVPLGRYVKEGLLKAGYWEKIEKTIIPTASAAQSVSYLASGEVEGAFLYLTDAQKLDPAGYLFIRLPQVEKAGYWAALSPLGAAKPAARDFLGFLKTPEGQAIFAKHGFEVRTGHED